MGEKHLLFILFSLAVITFAQMSNEVLAAGPISREEAYRLVEGLIIEGEFGVYRNVPKEKGVDDKKLELQFFPKPSVHDELSNPERLQHNPLRTGYRMGLSDRRGRRLFGLMGGGGWTFEGGLVDMVFLDGSLVELYGIQVLKWYNGLFASYYLEKQMIYDFYLVFRNLETRRGKILKKWTLKYDEFALKVPNANVKSLESLVEKGMISQRSMERTLESNKHEYLECYLNYFNGEGRVDVVIKGLKRDFQKTVSIAP